ncbi:MAG: TRAP transporter small permease [Geminicoccaceae bacterium]
MRTDSCGVGRNVRKTRLARKIEQLRKAAELVSAVLFATLFLTFVAQVFWRYVLRDPLVWTLEVAGILFVTLSLFTAATQMRMREHVALDLAVDLAPRRLAAWLRALSLILFASVMFLSIPDTVRVLEWMYRERTFAIKFNLGHLFVLMIGFVAIYAAKAVYDAVRMIRTGSHIER